MLAKLLYALVAAWFSIAAARAEIYKWTDDNGRVHYGNSIPESQKNKITKTFKSEPSSSGAQEPVSPAQKLTPKNRSTVESASQSAAQSPPAPAQPSTKKSKCEEAWRKYEESQACFAPYVLYKGRGVKAEAFEHCTVVPQPTETCN